jgi:glycosyltransferase involved in cell wall biosynthesis
MLVEDGSRRGYVDYLGPVFGGDKEAFFRAADVFLFPSRYRNELSPLVVWESLLHGVPVIAYRAGCLTEAAVGEGSLILDPDAPFLEAALAQLDVWRGEPTVLAKARRTARQHALAKRDQAIAEALSTGERVRSYGRRAGG